MKKVEQLPTETLMSYSKLLENVIASNAQVRNELIEGVKANHVSLEDIRPIMDKATRYMQEADEKYAIVEEELDIRMKRDLGISVIRKTRALFKEQDKLVADANERLAKRIDKDEADATRIAGETETPVHKLNPDQNADSSTDK